MKDSSRTNQELLKEISILKQKIKELEHSESERKHAEEALEKRLAALTRPMEDSEGIDFEELFNLDDIQRLQDEFARATGVASIITLPDGTPITAPSSFCRLCNDIIRKTEKGCTNCYKSDAVIGRLCHQGPTIQPCMSGGLWDAGAGISVGGRHIANWLIGQVRDSTQTEEKMRAYAREIGADESSVVDAFREVPAMSREQFERVAQALFTLANQISSTAYQNVQQARFITERKQAEEAIVLAKNDWENTFNAVTDMITIHDEDFNIVRANPAAKAIFGLQLQEGMPLAKCFRCYHGTEKPPSGCASCQSLQTGKPSTVEMFEPYLNKHLEIRAMPRFGSDGRSVGLIHVVRDITERKKAEEQLQHTLESLRKAFGAIIQVMVSAVESRDPYTAGHQIRSADLARTIAKEMGLPQKKIDGIRMAGSIHDIGKLSIPAEILSKPTKLSALEFSLIQEHAQKGFDILKDVESPWPLAEIVLQHHERMDGSGYPRNLKGDDILIEARILAVADVVEAMASHRPYRPGLGIDAALNEIEKNRGICYDDAVADACLRLFREKGFKLEGI